MLNYVRIDSITFKNEINETFAHKLQGKYCKIYRPEKHKTLRFGEISTLGNTEHEVGTLHVIAYLDDAQNPILEAEVTYTKNGSKTTHLRVFCVIVP